MRADELFLASDAALRSVVERIAPADLARPAPQEWTALPDPTVRDVLSRHAYDEAWVPGVLQGRAAADGDDLRDADLLGDDPVAAHGALYESATAAVRAGAAPGTVFRFTYGDYPAEEGYAHMATYRAFQAWSIASYLGIPFHLPPEVVTGMEEHVLPHVDQWRQWGVFPPAVEPPAGADAETRLLCATGHWKP